MLTYPIKEMLLSPSEFTRPQQKLNTVRGIVIHYTGGEKEPQAHNVRNYFETLKNQKDNDGIDDRYASAHFTVDRKQIILNIPLTELAYHCGAKKYMDGVAVTLGTSPNRSTWGIEMCAGFNDPKIPDETFKNTVSLVAHLIQLSRTTHAKFCKSGGLTTSDLYRHYDITGKNCPAPFIKTPSEWERFKKEVHNLLVKK